MHRYESPRLVFHTDLAVELLTDSYELAEDDFGFGLPTYNEGEHLGTDNF